VHLYSKQLFANHLIEKYVLLYSFLWGVGTDPGKDDIVKYHNMTRYDKSACASVTLRHNTIYYSTVVAYNNALNSKPANSSSDGGKQFRLSF